MGKRKSTNDQPRMFVNMLRPHNPALSLVIAQEAVAGKTPNLDQSLYPKSELKVLWEAAEAKTGLFPYMYCPVVAELGKARNAIFGLPGQPSRCTKQPATWPAKFGNWFEGATLGDFRLMHNVDIRKNCRIADGALVQVGDSEYIVGTPGEDGMAAPYCVGASKTGNYSANERVKDQLTFETVVTESGRKVTATEFKTVVAQLNNAPVLLTLEDGGQIAHMPNQVLTWGHLMDGDKALTPAQIRALKGEAKGIKFVPLPERWVGRPFAQSEFNKVVLREMKSDVREVDGSKTTLLERYEARPPRSEDKERQQDTAATVWQNIATVQTRENPSSLYCYGYRYAAIGKAIARTVAADGTIMVFGILGGHLSHGLTKTKWAVNAEAKEAEAGETPVEAAAPAETKGKSKGKAAKSKPAKTTKAKAQKSKGKSKSKSKGKKATTVVADTTVETPPATETTVENTEPVADAPTATEQVEAEALGIDLVASAE